MKALKRVMDILFRAEEWIGRILLVGMVVAVVLQVITRYVLNSPLDWTEELSRILFIWLVMLEMGHCVATKSHMRVELFVDMMPAKVRKGLNILMKILTIAFFVYLLPYSWQLTKAQHKLRTTALSMPYSYIYGTVTIGSVLVIIHLIASLVEEIRGEEDETT